MPPLALAPPQRPPVIEDVDALAAWRRHDVDELHLEPDDLQLLARLRAREDRDTAVEEAAGY